MSSHRERHVDFGFTKIPDTDNKADDVLHRTLAEIDRTSVVRRMHEIDLAVLPDESHWGYGGMRGGGYVRFGTAWRSHEDNALPRLQGENMPDDKTPEAEAKADAVIKTIEEVRLHRKQDPKGYRETLKNFAIKLGLTWLFSRSK